VGSDTEVHIERDGINALVMPEWAEHFDAGWFDPYFWGERAVPVSSGGRGSAWFIERSPEHWVLRHYRRGGLIARVSESAYVFLGENKTRSFAEFRLLQKLHNLGLPVPKPISAAYVRQGPTYSASIIIERLTGAVAWGDCLSGSADSKNWEIVGRLIRKFHDHGLDHADLNCFNVLLKHDEGFLIDFDRSVIRHTPSAPGKGWQASNLERLHRSLVKVVEQAGEPLSTVDNGWPKLLRAYFA